MRGHSTSSIPRRQHNVVVPKPTPAFLLWPATRSACVPREVFTANSKRTFTRFLSECGYNEQEFNYERLKELQDHGETRQSTDEVTELVKRFASARRHIGIFLEDSKQNLGLEECEMQTEERDSRTGTF